jgi:hypothetical protein
MGNAALTPKEIKRLRDRAYWKFYFRPRMALQALREISSLKSLFTTLTFIDWIKAGRKAKWVAPSRFQSTAQPGAATERGKPCPRV